MSIHDLFRVTFYTSKRKYTMMQFVDKINGKMFNYCPDNDPITYANCCNIKAIFNITLKYKSRCFLVRIFGKEFTFEIKSKY